MPRAEIVWNGDAKSYRVANQNFVRGRARTEDWSPELLSYLKSTRGFTVVDKAPPPKPPKAPEPQAEPEAPVDPPVESDGEERIQIGRGGKKR
jgi:hypothetical protein